MTDYIPLLYLVFNVWTVQTLGEYTAWTTYFWLRSDEGIDPYTAWNDAGSSYNNAVNRTAQELVDTSTAGYRNTLIDTFTTTPPDLMRLAFRNSDGSILYMKTFNTTGSSSTDWFTVPRMEGSYAASCIVNNDFVSYSVSFSLFDNTWGVERYYAVSLRHPSGSIHYLVRSGTSPLLLPVSAVPTTEDCLPSLTSMNPFASTTNVTNLYHEYCSSMCREQNHPYGAVHDTFCSCLGAAPTISDLSDCSIPCAGNGAQICGGVSPLAYPPETIIFNSVKTDIDISQFNVPLEDKDVFSVTGALEVSYTSNLYIYGFSVTVAAANLPVTIKMVLYYKPAECGIGESANATFVTSFAVTSTTPYLLTFETIYVRCAYLYLYDNSTETVLTFPVSLTTKSIQDNRFVLASIISIEAAWSLPEPVVTSEPTCECECWVYNMLYGDSPYNNLTYAELEIVLQNVTEKLEKELAVNKSELSSTIRKKTSAEDDRQSATVVGYSLGVALLTISIGGIILTDIPKMLGGMHILRENLACLFNRGTPPPPPPDVTLTTLTNMRSVTNR